MKQATVVILCTFLLMALVIGTAIAGNVSSAGKKGGWSSTTTWVGGVLPGPLDTVTIAPGDTVTVDITGITVAGIIVGNGVTVARLKVSNTLPIVLTVNGDLTVNANAGFNMPASSGVAGGNLVDTVFIAGNLTNTGNAFDLRNGTLNSTLTVANIIFIGSGNSNVTMVGGWNASSKNNNSFNGITINKSGNGRVILYSDVFLEGGTTGASPASSNPILTLNRGIVETGNFAIIPVWGSPLSVLGGSDSSYILGTCGRGMANSSATERLFPIGDSTGYRPCKVRSTTGGGNTGHYVKVSVVDGNAALGIPSFTSTIDKVSTLRYYKINYVANGVTSMSFDRFTPSYRNDDGVAAGNQNLRVAYSINRTSWTAYGPTQVPYTTALDSLPRLIASDTATSAVVTVDTVSTGSTCIAYFALARATGTTENSLVNTSTSVAQQQIGLPSRYVLNQNYPNPFNPSTNFTYQISKTGFVSLKIYDVLGREVATLANEVKQAGSYSATWNAARVGSGIYFCKMQSGSFSDVKKLILMK